MSRLRIFRPARLGTIIVGLVFALAVVGSGAYYANHTAEECQEQAEQHEEAPSGVVLREDERGGYRLEYNAQQEQHNETCFLGHTAEQWLALLTAWLVLGTILLAAFTAFLWLETSEASRKQRRADRKAHRRELRAYINVQGQPRADPVGASVEIALENTGRTPAVDCQARINRIFADPEIDPTWGYYDIYTEETPYHPVFTLGPRHETVLVVLLMTQEDIQRLAARVQGRLYAWGWCDYSDIFGDRHRTEFCFEIVGEETRLANGTIARSVRFRTGPDYNATDKQCRRRPLPEPRNP